MANAWKREKTSTILSPQKIVLLLVLSFFIFFLFLLRTSNSHFSRISSFQTLDLKSLANFDYIQPFDCLKSPQASPVFANLVEGVRYSFLFSLSDFGTAEKPNKNIVRMLKGKKFRKPDISETIQGILEKSKGKNNGIVVDIGANVGMASFAAAAMGFRVLAFEPVLENLQRICDGIFLNRAESLVTVFEAAASDRNGNITFHKLVGRLDNSAISERGAKLAFKENEEISIQVRTIPLDEVILETTPVLLMKIDVQGWEYHVLKGATKLLSRKREDAPYLIYEEDEKLLQASNSSSREIREFLRTVGYHSCSMHGTDAHCKKD